MAKQKQKELRTPRGTHDILPEEQPLWERIQKEAKETSAFYGFERINTPHIEQTELFTLGTGETTDIVTKQMYSFRTRGGDQLSLRPEGTPSVMRAYFEHGMWNLPQPVKLYYFGSFFRHEAPQRGRFREFHQWGLELIGEEGAVAEAEVVRVLYTFLDELGIKGIAFEVNSIGCATCRPHYRSALSNYYRSRAKGLCKDCKERFRQNPLRLLDCKEEKCSIVRQGAPQTFDHLCEHCKSHFRVFLEFLDEVGLPYSLNPFLVRGLDYYTRTVFEVFASEEVKSEPVTKEIPPESGLSADVGEKPSLEEKTIPEPHGGGEVRRLALGGGGRYDNLAELIGGRQVPAAGAAIGIERVILAWKAGRLKLPEPQKPKVFLAQLGDLAKKKSFALVETLRKANISVTESFGRDSIKSQLKIADKTGVEFALILGQKEALDCTAILREMSSGNQETVPQEKLVETLKRRLKK